MTKDSLNILLILFCFIPSINCSGQNVSPFQLANPRIITDQVFFTDSTNVQLKLDLKGVHIYYTLDGSDPDETSNKYSESILIAESKLLKTIAYHDQCAASDIVMMRLFKICKVDLLEASITPLPDERYAGDGVISLADHQKGSLNFKDGKWLGVAKKDLEVIYTFADTIDVSGVTVSTISDPNSWIFPPNGLEVWTEGEKGEFKKIGESNMSILSEMEKPNLQFHTCTFVNQKITNLKVLIKNTNTIPEWHLRAGKGSWLFVDELIIKQ